MRSISINAFRRIAAEPEVRGRYQLKEEHAYGNAGEWKL